MIRDTRSFHWEPGAPVEAAAVARPDLQPADDVAPLAAGFVGDPGENRRTRRANRASVDLLRFLAAILFLVAWHCVPSWAACSACLLGVVGLLAWLRWRRVRVFGPVCYYDLVRTGRRARFALVRVGYLAWLLVTLGTVYAGIYASAGGAGGVWFQQEASLTIRGAAEFAEAYFAHFAVAQFLAVVVLTPVYVAGALPEEKERGTVDGLFTTHLEDQEVVLGKMVSRLGHLLYLVLAGLPFIAVLQFFGGVSPVLVAAGFVMTLVTVLSLGAVSTWCGARSHRVLDAVWRTYGWVLGYLFASFLLIVLPQLVLRALVAGIGPVAPRLPPMLEFGSSLGNPVWAYAAIEYAQATGGGVEAEVVSIAADYVACHLVITFVYLFRAVRVSRQALLAPDAPLPLWRRTGVEFPPRLVRPPIGRWPALLWKEIHAEAPVGSSRLSAILMFVLRVFGWSLVAGFGFYLLFGIGLQDPAEHWVYTLLWFRQGARTLGAVLGGAMALLVPVYAAGAVLRERERQTLDGLLTLPVAPSEVLLAKWVGATLALRPLWVCLLVIWGVAVAVGAVHVLALPCLVVAWAVYAAAGSGLGLWFSLRCSSSLRAMIWTISTLFGLGFVRTLVLSEQPLLLQSWLPKPVADEVARCLHDGMAPWDGLAGLTFGYGEAPWGHFQAVGEGLAVCLVVGGALWVLNLRRWRREAMPAAFRQ